MSECNWCDCRHRDGVFDNRKPDFIKFTVHHVCNQKNVVNAAKAKTTSLEVLKSLFCFSGRIPAPGTGVQVRHVHPGKEAPVGGEVT